MSAYTGKTPASWSDVKTAAETRGYQDFAQALADTPAEVLEKHWRRRRPRTLGSRGKERRKQFINRVLERWREGSFTTAGAACTIRQSMSLPPPAPGPASRPSFPVGNQLSIVHGAGSPRTVAARIPAEVEEIKAVIAEEMGEHSLVDAMQIDTLARVRAQMHLLQEQDAREGLSDTAHNRWLRLVNTQQRLLGDMAMTRAAKARLQSDKALAAVNALEAQKRLRQRYGSV